MKHIKNLFRKLGAVCLSVALIGASINFGSIIGIDQPVAVKAATIDNLRADSNGLYDVMIKCNSDGLDVSNMDKKQIADESQKKIISVLELAKKNGKVDKYESFYIVNGIHAIISDKKVIEELSLLRNVDKIQNNGRIRQIEPIKKRRRVRSTGVIYTPDDRNIEWGVSQVHAEKVWDEFNVQGEGVTVGIIDTGVNYKLPAIKNAYKGYDSATNTFDSSFYKDFIDEFDEPKADSTNDHGTHVAGTICGREGNNLNQIGVAPKAKFISARAIDNNGGDVSDLLAAAQWMLEKKPDIINNSWGGDSDDNDWFKAVVDSWRDEGILPVFAAGNQRSGEPIPGPGSISNPGNMLNVFSVGAIDINKNLGSFSKKGPSAFDKTGSIIKPDVSAPGVQVRSVDARGKYVSWNGTSMATPHVAGVAALIKSAKPTISLNELEDLLRKTAEPLSDNKFPASPNMAYGHGLVNAYDAVASIKGRDMGSISGHVYKEGEDNSAAKINIISSNHGYVGRDFVVRASAKDDISIKNIKLLYKTNNSSTYTEKPMNLIEGVQNDGIYECIIKADELSEGDMDIKVVAIDFADNQTSVNQKTTIKGGIRLPYSEDFEHGAAGFLFNDRWTLTKKLSVGEPDMPNGGSYYVGVDGGKSKFEKNIESYMYLPPVDLSGLSRNSAVSLTLDEFKGFTGITMAKIETSLTGKDNDWQTLHGVIIRPDYKIEDRKWERNSYSLSKFAGESSPLLIRLYFLGHDAEEKGCGWYIDNIAIDKGDNTAPKPVIEFYGDMESSGLKLSFRMPEETDVAAYHIERKTDDTQFEEIASIDKNSAVTEFIHVNGNKLSHYRVNYYDKNIDASKNYTYRVRVSDLFGNYSEYSGELKVSAASTAPRINYDFNNDNGGFTTEVISGNVNDWEYGTPKRPSNPTYMQKMAWDGLENISGGLTNMWATKLNTAFSASQDACLVMPEFKVEQGDTLYIKSYNSITKYSKNTFEVEIYDISENSWHTLFGKDIIQNPDTSKTWQSLSKDLSSYMGKTVKIRFHAITDRGIISSEDIGWYIDDISVGGLRKHYEALNPINTGGAFVGGNVPMTGGNNSSTNSANGVPLRAKVQIVETGRYVNASELDGSYNITHTVNKQGVPYHVKVSAYGYEPVIVEADLFTNRNIKKDFVLKPAKQARVTGIVTDSSGNKISGATVKIAEDDRFKVAVTNSDGSFTLENVYTGEYTIRAFKNGYSPAEKTVNLVEGDNNIDAKFTLNILSSKKREVVDYGFVVEKSSNGYYQATHFPGSLKGNAVRFQSPHKGGILDATEIFLVNNQVYGGNHVMVAVLGYDSHGRLRELAPFKQVESPKANAWNRIDLSEYAIKRDEPIYIATRYEKQPSESMGVFYDVKAEQKAKDRSFIYDGSFISTLGMPAVGAYAIKTEWLYDDGAAINPETNVDDSSSQQGADTVKPEGDDVFEFDAATNTITKYNGKSPQVTVPAAINGVPVLNIGNKAFDRTNNQDKLKKIVISEGITTIGDEAFKNNKLNEIVLPTTLNKIGKNAFYGQWKSSGIDDTSISIDLKGNLSEIPQGAFGSVGSPVIVKNMDNVKIIRKRAFEGNKIVEINARGIQTIENGAFGNKNSSFEYAKIYTDIDTHLKSRDGEYLINPALVKIRMIDAKDSEHILQIGLKYGDHNPQSYSRDIPSGEFYQIGQRVLVKAPTATDTKTSVKYVSPDSKELVLERENYMEFYYYQLKPQVRMPIFASDKCIVGFSIPKANIKIEINSTIHDVKCDDDGFFKLDNLSLSENQNIEIKSGGQLLAQAVVSKWDGSAFVGEGTKLLRYMGSDNEVNIPTAIGSSSSIEEIGDFAFYEVKGLNKVVIPTAVQVIGTGAFLGSDLSEFVFSGSDINRSKLRIIKEYAFKDNNITKVALPELTHIIQKKAFENNRISDLDLPKYLGHIGNQAFKNNKIKDLTIYGNVEEIGPEAFMNNEIVNLNIKPKSATAHDSIANIDSKVFANNKIVRVELPETIDFVAKDCFDGNNESRVLVLTDNMKVEPGNHFDVLRSNGQIDSLYSANNKPVKPNNPVTPHKPTIYPTPNDNYIVPNDFIINDASGKTNDGSKNNISDKKSGKKTNNRTRFNWDVVKKHLSVASKVTVNLSDNVKIPKSIFRAIKGKNKTLVLRVNGSVVWRINGKSIKKIPSRAVDIKIYSKNDTQIRELIVNSSLGDYYGSIKCLANIKNLNLPISVKLNVGAKNKGKYLSLFKLNNVTKKLKLVCSVRISNSGFVNLPVNTDEEYVMIISKSKYGF